jgi:hypothetical protein
MEKVLAINITNQGLLKHVMESELAYVDKISKELQSTSIGNRIGPDGLPRTCGVIAKT